MISRTATQEIAVVKGEHGLLFFGDSQEVKAWLDDRGLVSCEFAAKALRTGGFAVQAATKMSPESGR